MSDLFLRTAALISPCGLYRYWLTRTWDEALPTLCWVMLNPSTADHEQDDPTIRRVLGFSRSWGCGGVIVVNLYALRSTEPKALWLAEDPVGPDNDRHLVEMTAGRNVIVAWGSHAQPGRVRKVFDLIYPAALAVQCLGLTRGGCPRHPLYLPGKTERIIFRTRRGGQ